MVSLLSKRSPSVGVGWGRGGQRWTDRWLDPVLTVQALATRVRASSHLRWPATGVFVRPLYHTGLTHQPATGLQNTFTARGLLQ